eukprot:365314-Chlamydomonas_euryale.AAC.5
MAKASEVAMLPAACSLWQTVNPPFLAIPAAAAAGASVNTIAFTHNPGMSTPYMVDALGRQSLNMPRATWLQHASMRWTCPALSSPLPLSPLFAYALPLLIPKFAPCSQLHPISLLQGGWAYCNPDSAVSVAHTFDRLDRPY